MRKGERDGVLVQPTDKVPPKTTIRRAHCSQVLVPLSEALKENHRSKLSRKRLLRYDSAPAHTYPILHKRLCKSVSVVADHLPHSSDFARGGDIFLFRHLRRHLKRSPISRGG